MISILVYCLGFKVGDSVVQGLKDMAFSEFSAQNEQDIATLLFRHVMGLGMDFHLKKETGKIIRVVSLGSESFSNLVRIVFFMFLPLILLISFQVAVLAIYCPYYICLITIGSVIFYYVASFSISNKRIGIFRQKS